LGSKNVDVTDVDAAADVKVAARRNPKEFELIRVESLKNSELIFVYLEAIGERLCVRLVVYVRLLARICLKAFEACRLSIPIFLKFIRFKILELSEGTTKTWAGETAVSSTFD
jgi:hypothetical protein